MGITRLTQYILYICADPSARYKVQLAMYENCVIKVSFVYTSKTKCSRITECEYTSNKKRQRCERTYVLYNHTY